MIRIDRKRELFRHWDHDRKKNTHSKYSTISFSSVLVSDTHNFSNRIRLSDHELELLDHQKGQARLEHLETESLTNERVLRKQEALGKANIRTVDDSVIIVQGLEILQIVSTLVHGRCTSCQSLICAR